MGSRLAPRLLKKALDLVEADPARAWAVGEIASACGVPRRTLQRHFRRFVGRTPTQFVRDLRLDKARKELVRALDPVSVTEIAGRCDFNHLGRFAAQYRERYGESPSATLLRQQNVLVSRGRRVRPAAIERPAIAVLPFDLIGTHACRVEGIADEIATALMRLRWIAVAAPEGARYHVRGKIRADGTGGLRAAAFLVDTATGRYLWADRWDGNCDDLFEFEERIAARVASAVQSPVREAEIDRAWRQDPARLNAWELTMRALRRVLSVEAAAEETALELLEQAMELSPDDALPVALAAWCHGLRGCHNLCPRPDREKAAARALAARASQLTRGDALAETLLAAGYTLGHDLLAAAVHAERALESDGGSAWAWGRSGWIKAYSGEAAAAIECFHIARALSPADPQRFLWSVGIGAAHFGAARYDVSAHWFERALLQNPAAVWINSALAPAYTLAGRKEPARRSVAEVARAFPDLTISKVRSGLPFRSSYLDRVAEGLEGAGMR